MWKYEKYLDFHELSGRTEIPNHFLEKHAHEVDWHLVVTNGTHSRHFLEKFFDYIDWERLYSNEYGYSNETRGKSYYSTEFIKRNWHRLPVNSIKYQLLTRDTVEVLLKECPGKINWDNFFKNRCIEWTTNVRATTMYEHVTFVTPEFIERYNVPKKIVSQHIDLSNEKQVKNFEDCIDWKEVSRLKKLHSYNALRHKNKMVWSKVLKRNRYKEKDIETLIKEGFVKFKEWQVISIYQPVSEEFLEKHWDNIDKRSIALSYPMSEEFLKKHMSEFNVDYLAFNVNIENHIKNRYDIKTEKTYDEILKKLSKDRRYSRLSRNTRKPIPLRPEVYQPR